MKELAKLGKPIALVIYAGRPIVLEGYLSLVDSVLYSWHLGTMAGPALADLIVGNVSPSGRLPVTFPRNVGQIPLFYNKRNTGRPNNDHWYVPYSSCYMDIDSQPLFPFGFGLTYSSFKYSFFKMSKTTVAMGESLTISVLL